ncbi:MAG: BrnT family toxin [Verrucomicrobia bacterium]|nr:BrnT family toxin [Verrucomicrobiota bacterium]
MSLSFEWDPTKAIRNIAKHGVSFLEAGTSFADPYSLTIPDPDHSKSEDRFILLGRSANFRLLVVVYTERGYKIRMVSARPASRKERAQYEHSRA